MAEIVVDSSVAIKWFVEEPYSIEARKILAKYETDDLVLHAPDLIIAEVANTIWKKQRLQLLEPADAIEVLNSFRKIELSLSSCASLVSDAHQLAVSHQRTVYDMMYVALSRMRNCSFVTADERMVNAIGESFSQIVWLPNWSRSEMSPQKRDE